MRFQEKKIQPEPIPLLINKYKPLLVLQLRHYQFTAGNIDILHTILLFMYINDYYLYKKLGSPVIQ